MEHAELHFYDDNKECDMCNNRTEVAVIESLGGDFLLICKECLEKIIKGFEL